MVERRTPAHKRARRAEDARDEWKAKATERREEAEKWKAAAKRKTDRIDELQCEKAELKKLLAQEQAKTEELEEKLK